MFLQSPEHSLIHFPALFPTVYSSPRCFYGSSNVPSSPFKHRECSLILHGCLWSRNGVLSCYFFKETLHSPVQGNHTVFLVHHFIDFIIFIICLNINIYLMNYWLIIDYLPPTSMSLIQIRKNLQSFIYTCIIRRIWQSISDPQIIVVVISDTHYPLTTMCPFLFTHNPLHLQTCWHQRQLFLTSFFFKSFTKSPFQASQTTIALFSF